MEDFEKSVVFCGSVPLIVNGKRYEVMALPIKEVIGNDDFQSSGLYFPDAEADEPINNWQAVYLRDEQYRNALDKWLNKLVTFNGEPMSLELIAVHGWTDASIGEFLSLVLKVSGLTRKKEDADKEPATPNMWLDVLTEFQYHLRASWKTVMSMPLLQLDALRERVLRHAVNDNISSMSRLLSNLAGGGAVTAPPTADPLKNTMPQPKSRDEYFAMMNNLR